MLSTQMHILEKCHSSRLVRVLLCQQVYLCGNKGKILGSGDAFMTSTFSNKLKDMDERKQESWYLVKWYWNIGGIVLDKILWVELRWQKYFRRYCSISTELVIMNVDCGIIPVEFKL